LTSNLLVLLTPYHCSFATISWLFRDPTHQCSGDGGYKWEEVHLSKQVTTEMWLSNFLPVLPIAKPKQKPKGKMQFVKISLLGHRSE
jgi:hypothetical protein